jgi:hypothetical protein
MGLETRNLLSAGVTDGLLETIDDVVPELGHWMASE